MREDFDSRWTDGSDINKYSLGILGTNKAQVCGYTKGQVLYFPLDPRMIMETACGLSNVNIFLAPISRTGRLEFNVHNLRFGVLD